MGAWYAVRQCTGVVAQRYHGGMRIRAATSIGLALAAMLVFGCSGEAAQSRLPTRDLQGTPAEFGYPSNAYDPCPETPELFTLGTLCVTVPNTAGATHHEVEVNFGQPVGATAWTFTISASVRSFWPPEPLGADRITLCDHGPSIMVNIRAVDAQGIATQRISSAADYPCGGAPH